MLNISRENDLTHITQLNEQHLLKTEQLNYSIKTTPTEILTIWIRWRRMRMDTPIIKVKFSLFNFILKLFRIKINFFL